MAKKPRALPRVRGPLQRYNRGGGPHGAERESLLQEIETKLVSDGISMRKLAELSGVSVGQLSGVLNREKQGTIDLLITLAQALGLTHEFSS